MTRYERDIMTDNNIAPDLMEQIGKYLKQKRRASTLPRKQTNVMSKELLDDIMSFVDENPNATMDDIVNDFGTPEEYENQLYENESDHEVEKIKQRIKFMKKYFMGLPIRTETPTVTVTCDNYGNLS